MDTDPRHHLYAPFYHRHLFFSQFIQRRGQLDQPADRHTGLAGTRAERMAKFFIRDDRVHRLAGITAFLLFIFQIFFSHHRRTGIRLFK